MFVTRNLIAYPAGYAPGFDPSHIASRNIICSIVAHAGGSINILKGTKGAIVGAPTPVIRAHIGPALNCPAGTAYHTFGGFLTAAQTVFTVATILQMGTVDPFGFHAYFQSSNAGSGDGAVVSLFNATFHAHYLGGANFDSGIAGVTGGSYFHVASVNGATTVNQVVTNLATGRVLTNTQAGSGTAPTTDGTIRFAGCEFSAGLFAVAAQMYSASYMTLPQMIAWANDPWSFWYPDAASDYWDYPMVAAAAAAGGRIWRLAGDGGGLVGEPRGLAG